MRLPGRAHIICAASDFLAWWEREIVAFAVIGGDIRGENALEKPINLPTNISFAEANTIQPRANGNVDLWVKPDKNGTVIRDLRQSGSTKCLFPRRSGRGLEAVLVNTAGGITGGDSFTVHARTDPGTELTVTTQAAERAYQAHKDEAGHVENRLHVGENARINWLSQETILFNNSALTRSMRIDLNARGRLLFCEPLIFGRLAMAERLENARFEDHVEIWREGQPLYLDYVRFLGDVQNQLDRPFVAGGARAMANVVYVAPDAEAHLAPLREMLPDAAGASLLGEDMLVLRLLAPDGFLLRQTLIPVLTRLHGQDLPRCWMT